MDSPVPMSDFIRSFATGKMSRREFIIRGTAMGLSMSAIAALVAACSNAATTAPGSAAPAGGGSSTGPWAADPQSVTGEVKVLKGPFLADEGLWEGKYADRFHQQYPNATAKWSPLEWTQATPMLQAALSAGTADLLYIPEDFYPTFEAKGGPLEDLTPWMEDPGFKKVYADVPPAYITRSESPGGVRGGMPWVDGPQNLLFVNLDLLAKAGVDPTAWAASYDAMTEAARKVAALGSDTYGIAILENGALNFGFHFWYGEMLRAGVDYLNADWTAPGFNTPEFAQALQRIQDWHQKDKVMPPFGQYGWDQSRALFAAGKVALYTDEPEFTGVLTKTPPPFKWDVSKFPPGAKADVLYANCGMWCMSNKSQIKQTTWEAMKSYVSPFVEYSDACGVNPIVTDWEALGYWKGQPVRAAVQNLFKYLHGAQLHPKVVQMRNLLDPLFDQVWAGRLTPQEALDQGDAAIKGIL